jgi:hypothetical protein
VAFSGLMDRLMSKTDKNKISMEGNKKYPFYHEYFYADKKRTNKLKKLLSLLLSDGTISMAYVQV